MRASSGTDLDISKLDTLVSFLLAKFLLVACLPRASYPTTHFSFSYQTCCLALRADNTPCLVNYSLFFTNTKEQPLLRKLKFLLEILTSPIKGR